MLPGIVAPGRVSVMRRCTRPAAPNPIHQVSSPADRLHSDWQAPTVDATGSP